MADIFDSVAKLQELRGSKLGTLAQIQAARRAMNLLDSQITAAEVRLRALPSKVGMLGVTGYGSTKGLTARQRMAARRGKTMSSGVFAMGETGARLGGFRVGRKGAAVSPDGLRQMGGPALASAAIMSSIFGGLGNQMMDLKEEVNDMQAQGMTDEEARKRILSGAGKTVIRGISDVFGASDGIKLWLRVRGGLSEEQASSRVENAWRDLFETEGMKFERVAEAQRRFSFAADRVMKQYEDDNTFLDTFTPDDFDVYGDHGRNILRQELREKNRKYVDHLARMRLNAAKDSAAKDVRAD